MSPSEFDTPRPEDDRLLQRYREANALDDARPRDTLRAAVLAKAHEAANQTNNEGRATPTVRGSARPAANEPQWALRALGSLAVLGLVGLLVLQFDLGSPEEKELALGAPRSASAPVESPAAARSATPSPSGDVDALSRHKPPASDSAATPEASPPRATAPVATAPQHLSNSSPELSPQAAPLPQSVPAPGAAAPASASEVPSLAQERRATEAARRESLLPAPVAPLLQAAAQGNADRVREAIARGDNLHASDAHGRTALMLAAGRGDLAMVQLLLGAGADPTLTDAAGRTAADLARAAGHGAVVEALTHPR